MTMQVLLDSKEDIFAFVIFEQWTGISIGSRIFISSKDLSALTTRLDVFVRRSTTDAFSSSAFSGRLNRFVGWTAAESRSYCSQRFVHIIFQPTKLINLFNWFNRFLGKTQIFTIKLDLCIWNCCRFFLRGDREWAVIDLADLHSPSTKWTITNSSLFPQAARSFNPV